MFIGYSILYKGLYRKRLVFLPNLAHPLFVAKNFDGKKTAKSGKRSALKGQICGMRNAYSLMGFFLKGCDHENKIDFDFEQPVV